jgi:hypothetical protein
MLIGGVLRLSSCKAALVVVVNVSMDRRLRPVVLLPLWGGSLRDAPESSDCLGRGAALLGWVIIVGSWGPSICMSVTFVVAVARSSREAIRASTSVGLASSALAIVAMADIVSMGGTVPLAIAVLLTRSIFRKRYFST